MKDVSHQKMWQFVKIAENKVKKKREKISEVHENNVNLCF